MISLRKVHIEPLFFILVILVFKAFAIDNIKSDNLIDVVNITSSTFDKMLAKKPYFVMFYVPG